LCVGSIVNAQTYIGISADVGNQLNHHAITGETYFKRPASISGSINFLRQESMRNNWLLRYGMVAGVLGYNIKVLLQDTLNQMGTSDPFVFLDYTNLYLTVPFVIGKEFNLKNRNVRLLLGGGGTYYVNLFPGGVTGSISVVDDNSDQVLFDYEMLPAGSKLYAFAEISIQTELSRRLSIGLLYRHHFKAALEGTYNFYHSTSPSNGNLSVQQRALSVLCLARIGKRSS
jgi:hypothetical protein